MAHREEGTIEVELVDPGNEVGLIVSDDGDRAAGRYARYLLIDPADLRIG